MNCFKCNYQRYCFCKKSKKPQCDADFTRPADCEFLELNNLNLNEEELKVLPKIKKEQIEKGKVIGKLLYSPLFRLVFFT